jgi:hypothetical protein
MFRPDRPLSVCLRTVGTGGAAQAAPSFLYSREGCGPDEECAVGADGEVLCFLYGDGVLRPIADPSCRPRAALDINNRSQVVGQAWDRRTLTDLGTLGGAGKLCLRRASARVSADTAPARAAGVGNRSSRTPPHPPRRSKEVRGSGWSYRLQSQPDSHKPDLPAALGQCATHGQAVTPGPLCRRPHLHRACGDLGLGYRSGRGPLHLA